MHLHLALMGRALLRPRRHHPLDDPLDAPEWAGFWRVFEWRAALHQCRRNPFDYRITSDERSTQLNPASKT